MASGTRTDATSLPKEESLPYPLQERGEHDQRWLASQQQQEMVLEDLPSWWELAYIFRAKFQRIWNVYIAPFVTYLLAVVTEILKIFSVQKDKTRERNEMKTKVEKIIQPKLEEIKHHKSILEEQTKTASGNHFKISHKESMEWEMNLMKVKELVFQCGAEIACLQKLVCRLESRARIKINWILVQYLITGLVMIGVLFYWVLLRTDVKVITAVCLLGVATHCIREAQVLFDFRALASECEQVKEELEEPMMACLMYKHAVENFLPEKKKRLHVVDHETPKCKND